jgi:hypothetical protein
MNSLKITLNVHPSNIYQSTLNSDLRYNLRYTRKSIRRYNLRYIRRYNFPSIRRSKLRNKLENAGIYITPCDISKIFDLKYLRRDDKNHKIIIINNINTFDIHCECCKQVIKKDITLEYLINNFINLFCTLQYCRLIHQKFLRICKFILHNRNILQSTVFNISDYIDLHKDKTSIPCVPVLCKCNHDIWICYTDKIYCYDDNKCKCNNF